MHRNEVKSANVRNVVVKRTEEAACFPEHTIKYRYYFLDLRWDGV